MTSVPVTFEGSVIIYELEAGPFNLLRGALNSQFEVQPINIPASHEEFLAYQEFMSPPFQLEDFRYEFLLVGDYLQDERLDSLLHFIRQQILEGQVILPPGLPEEYLEILFRVKDREYTPGELGFLLEQENFHANWPRLYPYFPLKIAPGFEWKVPLLSISYKIEHFHLPEPDFSYRWSDLSRFKPKYLEWALVHGLVKVVKYLVSAAKLNSTDIRSDNNWALRLAVEYGHLKVVKYLVTRFDLTKRDLQTNDYEAFREAASRGYLEIIQFFGRKFDLRLDDFQDQPERSPIEIFDLGFTYDIPLTGPNWAIWSLDQAAKNGHLEVVRYLSEYFNLTKADLYHHNSKAFRLAAINGHLEVVRYLTQFFMLNRSDFQINPAYFTRRSVIVPPSIEDTLSPIIAEARERGHMEVVRYLVNYFGVTSRDQDNEALRQAVRTGHLGNLDILNSYQP